MTDSEVHKSKASKATSLLIMIPLQLIFTERYQRKMLLSLAEKWQTDNGDRESERPVARPNRSR
jgi:hypothetical protein